MEGVKEIRRERVIIPPGITTKKIREKYGLKTQKACNAKRKGFFVKNYSRKQIIIDESRYDPHIAYGVARKVFRRNFLLNPVAITIREDLIQEAVTRMYELSGKAVENEKYSANYYFFWVAHNAMHSFLKTWERQTRYHQDTGGLHRSHKERGKEEVSSWIWVDILLGACISLSRSLSHLNNLPPKTV